MLTNEISSSFQTNYIKDIPWTSLIENAAKIQNDINSIQ